MKLWDIYINKNPNFLQRLESLGAENADKFLKRFSGEKNIENFNSIISELQFCEFFQENGYKISYEKKYFHQELDREYIPDVTVNQFEKDIIVEIFRLNPVQVEIDKEKFFQYFFENRVTLKYSYNIEIKLDDNFLDLAKYDKPKILLDLNLWLSTKRVEGDKFVIDKFLDFTVVKETNYSNVGFKYNASIKFDKRRIVFGLQKKATQHINLLRKINMPYLICMKANLETAVNENDLLYAVYGDLVSNLDHQTFRSELNGLFYEDLNSKKYLSGVILMINSSIFFFQNFANSTLGDQNINFFSTKQYYQTKLSPSKIEWIEKVELNS